MKRALGEFIIEGVKTTIPFNQIVLNRRQFSRGNVTTSFIENNKIMEELKGLKPKKEVLPKDKKVLIVTTAVSQYLAKKHSASQKPNPWIIATKQKSIN